MLQRSLGPTRGGVALLNAGARAGTSPGLRQQPIRALNLQIVHC